MKQDIIVIGAGPAGLSFARDMAETGLKITLIEKQPEIVLADPPYDGREIALTHLSYKIMNDLGMWDLIAKDDISLIKTAKVMNGHSPYALSFDHTEAGENNLGFMISNNRIRKAAYESLKGYDNIQILCEKEVASLGTDSGLGWVELKDGARLEAPLIVAADSRFSTTRRMMGISTSMLDFGRTCVVCTMSAELPHDDTAYECFHFDRTLAVLPLNNNQVSVVITLPSEESATLLSMSKEDFAKDIERRTESRFGAMALTSELFPYPLVATFAKKFHARRFAVVGDAAVGMHPVTAHGFNLGLRGAHTLAKELKNTLQTGGDIGSYTPLERYSRVHVRTCTPLYHGTNILVKLYTKDTPAAKFARRALLRLGNRIKPAKRLIMNQLTENKAA
ncbi:MAG: 5-demethoxyubiquinol-8 5-hydroxylase UbiM [Rhodospirillales bacterium]|nr:5-demethoxyubiquinol-8 5-hydroxylase UbiM [Rhodospirillales bacterium]